MKLISAILTKFDEKGKLVLDEEYARFLSRLLEVGVDGFLVCGTNGEFHVMDVQERKAIFEFVREKFSSRAEIVAHIGAASFKETVELGKIALELGIKRLAVVTPYYYRYDQKALAEYFVAVARELEDAQILLYNIPVFTGNRLEARTIIDIKLKAGNVVGIKDTDRRPQIVKVLKKELGEDFEVYGGADDMTIHYAVMGADGQVSGTSNVFPRLLRSILDSVEKGKIDEAAEKQIILNEAIEGISGKTAFVAANKYALKLLGYNVGVPRLPSRTLSAEEEEEVKQALGRLREWYI